MAITRGILPPISNQNYSKLGQKIQYGNYFAIGNIFHSYNLLSGGPSVRSTTTVINSHEIWEISSTGGIGGNVKYGDLVKLVMPQYSNYLLSGGPNGMRTTTTTCGVDETWQIGGLLCDRTGQEIIYGDLIILSMPKYDDKLLSGGPNGMRTNTTRCDVDEAWVIVCPR